jgi:hypothetical protein
MAEKDDLTGEMPEEKEAAEAKAAKEAEEKAAAEAAGGGDAPEPDPEFDYTDVLVDTDKVELEKGEKITFAEAKKRNAIYKKHKELLDKVEKDPELLNKLAKTVEPDPGKGAPASEKSAELTVTKQLLREAFERKCAAIKDKYPLVSKEEIAARILSMQNPDLDQVEKVAASLQQYFDKKLGEKEKMKIKARENADDIDPQAGAPQGGGPKPADKSNETGLEDTEAMTREVEEAINKK